MKSSRANKWQKSRPSQPAKPVFGGPRRQPGKNEAYITGWNGVRECLASPHVKVVQAWIDPRKLSREDYERIRPYSRQIEELKGKETPYGELSQGIGALVRLPEWDDLDDLLDGLEAKGVPPLLVALDQVEDPMNLGQILRTCEGAGVHGLLVPKHRAIHLNQTVAQVSQGAFAWVPLIEVTNLRHTLDSAKQRGLWVIGTAAGEGSRPWYQVDFRENSLLVMGAEGKGLRRLTVESCDFLVELPMAGRLDSLNVGAATAAVLYEAVRQRHSAPD